ncbi:arad-like aldolase/epimerase [Lindgomyces ingoldianus]|uniref:Arad-like aldolase/epimerase n=1 Tax=Lindgomyces ingoldianus TaxID=673940 RepID=A0ACB6QHK0_9PLEO|nr:arad-like aldolase/epimerase [Lindgomyces ingoldianus]KAF2465621.1 arad-like aldolase/epimerase [Lindgomyces ingoldianus]
MPNQSTSFPPEIKSQLQLLISANHILHYHGLVDAFGHISIRHPLNPNHYIIASYNPGAPALVSSFAHFIEYRVSDSSPLDQDAPRGYSERYIHSEIFKRFPRVMCVVHSHSEAVIPFMTAGVQIRPVFHMAGFLGKDGPPTFDVTRTYQDLESRKISHSPDMLIKTEHLGAKLAETFDVQDRAFGDVSVEREVEARPVVLQHKHGFTCVGDSIQNAVYRAIYLQKNCALLKNALDLQSVKRASAADISFLTEEEAKGCAKMNEMTADKAFRLWLREVEVNPLYRNEEGVPKDLPVGGMKD